jgi:hypothetical protein
MLPSSSSCGNSILSSTELRLCFCTHLRKLHDLSRWNSTLELAGLCFCRLLFYPAKAQLGFTRAKRMENQPVSFPNWKEALAQGNLSPPVKSSHLREILTFLHHCKKARSPATVVLIKQWLATRETQTNGPAHAALRWFYREGSREQAAPDATGVRERISPSGPSGSAAPGSATPATCFNRSPTTGSTAYRLRPRG